MGARRVSKQGVTVSEGNAIEVTNTAGTALFSVNSTGNINTLANLTAKGSILTASAANTPAVLTVGNAGETLVADSSTSTGLRWTAGSPQGNPVLNSAMQVWQRGTSFANSGSNVYGADRWASWRGGFASGSTVSRQTTSDTTNLPFIQYCARVQRDSGNTSTQTVWFAQAFENVNSTFYAGKTVTLSFYARRGANFSPTSNLMGVQLASGTGTDQALSAGFTNNVNAIDTTVTLTTTWQRFSATGTIGTDRTQIGVAFFMNPTGTAGAADFYEITGIQLDVGSVALPFRTYAETLAGELAACQRYFRRYIDKMLYQSLTVGFSQGTTRLIGVLNYAMRSTPSCIVSAAGHFYAESGNSGWITVTAVNLFDASSISTSIAFDVSSGLTNGQAGRLASGSSSATLDLSAEL